MWSFASLSYQYENIFKKCEEQVSTSMDSKAVLYILAQSVMNQTIHELYCFAALSYNDIDVFMVCNIFTYLF